MSHFVHLNSHFISYLVLDGGRDSQLFFLSHSILRQFNYKLRAHHTFSVDWTNYIV